MLFTFFKSNKQKQTGFTLIEILVSLLILSIGLLGLAALQLTGMKHSQSAHYRSLAVNLAYDIADRIRVNRGETYSTALTDAPPSVSTDCESNSVNCTPAQLATFDIAHSKCSLGDWDSNGTNTSTVCTNTLNVEGDLPLGDGAISKSGDIYTITVKWDDTRSGTADTTFTLEFTP